ncbi:unnamed protein product [Victoria cruziana]
MMLGVKETLQIQPRGSPDFLNGRKSNFMAPRLMGGLKVEYPIPKGYSMENHGSNKKSTSSYAPETVSTMDIINGFIQISKGTR